MIPFTDNITEILISDVGMVLPYSRLTLGNVLNLFLSIMRLMLSLTEDMIFIYYKMFIPTSKILKVSKSLVAASSVTHQSPTLEQG